MRGTLSEIVEKPIINIIMKECFPMYIQELRKLATDFPLVLVRPTLIMLNHEGEILLVKHSDDTWGLPGGLLEPGESVEGALKRELNEELDVCIDKLTLFKIFSGNGFRRISKSGAETHYVAITYLSESYSGYFRIDNEEVIEYGFFNPKEIPNETTGMIKEIINEYIKSEHYKGIIVGDIRDVHDFR
jgi:ADP-ribose pyrophosphatase YjhB (NUDIX family)